MRILSWRFVFLTGAEWKGFRIRTCFYLEQSGRHRPLCSAHRHWNKTRIDWINDVHGAHPTLFKVMSHGHQRESPHQSSDTGSTALNPSFMTWDVLISGLTTATTTTTTTATTATTTITTTTATTTRTRVRSNLEWQKVSKSRNEMHSFCRPRC